MLLSELVAPETPSTDVEITGLTADSREVKPGYLFAAFKGVSADGRAFIPDALEAGAAAVLGGADLPDQSAPVVRDPNPRRRLAQLAARFYPRQPGVVVAVTGTNGKSSTVEFLRQIWAAAGVNAAAFGTLGVRWGGARTALAHTTPDPVAVHRTLDQLARDGVTHAAMEASSHGLAQHRMDGVTVVAVGFTNLTQDHLDYHADFDAYFAAKLRLFTDFAEAGAPAVVNVDSTWGEAVAETASARGLVVSTIGWAGADWTIDEIMPHAAGQKLQLRVGGRDVRVELPLVGEFQAHNAMVAAALAVKTGVEEDAALKALEALKGVPGRLELAGVTSDGAPVFVDFAHTPDGLDKLLRALRPHTRGRVVLVFGAGGDRDPSKRRPMGEIAARLSDAAIVTDDNPRSEAPGDIRRAVLSGCPDSDEIADRAAAIRVGVARLGAGDALVIAGKGHETGQDFGDRVVAFDDVAEARAALRERRTPEGGEIHDRSAQ